MLIEPKIDGFYMPAEYAKHKGCILVWPERPGSWPHGAEPARRAFTSLIKAISESEHVFLCVSETSENSAREAFENDPNVTLFRCATDDAWARDIGPTFVVNSAGDVRGVDWQFNAWGGDFNGLYAQWDKDDAFASCFARNFGYECYDAHPFVLEGGSIHSDGEGTILVTESCLLSKGRNPNLSKNQISEKLMTFLGAEKVIWLPRGIYNDETDEHVDNVCAFVGPAEVVLAWTDNDNDPQYELSKACMDVLQNETDAKGRKITVHKLPIPDIPIVVTEKDLCGYVFADGEDNREIGERLAASYVNFYFSNNAVIVPAFGGDQKESDIRAQSILKEICKERKIIPIDARDILLGGGNIHCVTQQIPG